MMLRQLSKSDKEELISLQAKKDFQFDKGSAWLMMEDTCTW